MSEECVQRFLETTAKLKTIEGVQNPEDFLTNRNLEQRKSELLQKVLNLEQEAHDTQEKLQNAQIVLETIKPVSSKNLETLKVLEDRRKIIIEKHTDFEKDLKEAEMTTEDYNNLLKMHDFLKMSVQEN